eukprot:TRINITY_DN5668_c0_g2_i1.p1 TRINITY_DN5668_c0_g2~~TRINITY_DN5668_c0_g2_i1.p1  ORF type:complete len:478 (+),score=125.98 TRINITY_DN5668_c0_g2_i1:83-1435(+)
MPAEMAEQEGYAYNQLRLVLQQAQLEDDAETELYPGLYALDEALGRPRPLGLAACAEAGSAEGRPLRQLRALLKLAEPGLDVVFRSIGGVDKGRAAGMDGLHALAEVYEEEELCAAAARHNCAALALAHYSALADCSFLGAVLDVSDQEWPAMAAPPFASPSPTKHPPMQPQPPPSAQSAELGPVRPPGRRGSLTRDEEWPAQTQPLPQQQQQQQQMEPMSPPAEAAPLPSAQTLAAAPPNPRAHRRLSSASGLPSVYLSLVERHAADCAADGAAQRQALAEVLLRKRPPPDALDPRGGSLSPVPQRPLGRLRVRGHHAPDGGLAARAPAAAPQCPRPPQGSEGGALPGKRKPLSEAQAAVRMIHNKQGQMQWEIDRIASRRRQREAQREGRSGSKGRGLLPPLQPKSTAAASGSAVVMAQQGGLPSIKEGTRAQLISDIYHRYQQNGRW